MGERRRRYMTQRYVWTFLKRRRHRVVIVLFLLGVIGILILFSHSTPDYWNNLSLNIAADLIGLLVVLFVVTPFIERAELRIDSVLERFDHRAFIRKVAGRAPSDLDPYNVDRSATGRLPGSVSKLASVGTKARC